jgi:CheY-like chemotaxis protein
MMRILVVDDDEDIRVTTCMLLEWYGHAVDTAFDGAEALDAAQKSTPQVILLDLNMPRMDGFETARRLRAGPPTDHVLIIAVSGYVGDKEWCDRAIAAGVDECLGKPLDYDKLAEMIGRGREQSPGDAG